MKNLANCKPSEFLRQANLVKKSVEKWLTDTDILNIRKRLPSYEVAPKGATAEERKAIIERNAEKQREQTRENLSKILDAVLEEHPDETLEVLALCCFIDPENADDHKVGEYLQAFAEIISDKDVLSFFTSLAQLARMSSS